MGRFGSLAVLMFTPFDYLYIVFLSAI